MNPTSRIVVFAGPSLPEAERPTDPRLLWRPPARAGDALEWDAAACRLVVLIDGAFDAQPSVRHKELLLLISRGVAVIGAASMGALRAAELDRHGMIGVGRIYRAYAAGHLIGDDEVALLHGPAATGWAPLTEPLVNVRATLQAAVRGRILTAAAARQILQLAADTFYQERTWDLLLVRAALAGFAEDRLAAWLPRGRVDLKRRDALDAIDLALGADIPTPDRPPPPLTSFTAALMRQAPARPAPD